MTRYLAALVLAAALPAAAAAQEDVSELARDYVELPEVQTMMDEMFAPESMAQQFQSGLPPSVTLTDAQREEVGVILSEAMNGLRPEMEEVMITGSANHFTAAELQALIDFYSSEHGGAVMAKMQPFMQETMGTMMPRIQAQMQEVTPQLIEIIEGE
ncbi:DUF2059 domain-containing protein [Roseivivax sediminis]|uniref:DUF2059 domain-containing protein n=1 Tax=Roseivivax sediminis TaxID=936889 RepID=A0A1I1YQB6_9RHOB|nr:DUF2059 domain-containing protein [Roseivivax sediminis]SFE20140.1 hypothetical protein SAMN04515678_10792 [Roseivivax sediminis]